MCPMLDDRNDTPSAHQMAGLGVWDQQSNETGWTALLGDRRGGPDVSPYASPGRAEDLSGLPPALLDIGSAETFLDQQKLMYERVHNVFAGHLRSIVGGLTVEDMIRDARS